jgi:hypothetical protein
VQKHSVKRPFFVSSNLLFHGCQETLEKEARLENNFCLFHSVRTYLRVEEACHPEDVRLALEQPAIKLSITI